VLHGFPGIAVSHYVRRSIPLDWSRASEWLMPILARLTAERWREGSFWNINLPHLEANAARPEIVECPLDPTPLPLSFRTEGEVLHYNGDYHGRQRRPGADVDICFSGKIALTRMALL